MSKSYGRLPSPAMTLAFIALLVALGGTAVALPGKNSVKRDDIARNSVVSTDIRNNTVRTQDIRNSTVRGKDVRNDTLKGADVDESSLNIPAGTPVATAVTAGPLGFARISSAGGVDEAQAKDVADANVTRPSAGRYCFNNLNFDPKSIQVTGEFVVNRDFFGTTKPFDHFACPGAEDAEVTVTANNATPTNEGFFVVFH